jgi:probable phosphoglycerate mutase
VATPTDVARLLVVRHGRTAWNAEDRAQGHADISLDDVGRTQGETMARWLAQLHPDRLWSSDLARARETAAFLEKETGLTAVDDPRLRELDLGERTGLTRAEFAEKLGDGAPEPWDVHAHVMVPGAETLQQVLGRIAPAMTEALDSLAPGETGVVVTHGAALRVALTGLLGWPLAAHATLDAMHNCAWATVVRREGGPARLAVYNQVVPGTHPDWPSPTGVG